MRSFCNCSRLGADGRLLAASLALPSGLITREHLSRDLLRAPGDDRLDGLIAYVCAGNVIGGPEPPPIMLNLQAYLSAPILRYPAHALARLARVRLQASVSFFFVHHGVISLPSSSVRLSRP
jgi:hypothetical protein